MKYRVELIIDAEDDLYEIGRYVGRHDSPEAAAHLLNRLEEACRSLADLPERGHLPPELERIGVPTYREVDVTPYRIIYRVAGRKVYVHAVLDGRRDMADLLHRRLVR
ncbi:MAG: type II toxin-antitoxin system RelE/ParE family toxin [Gemmatimonadota bacterium]